MFFPNNGIALRFIAIASNGPSHKIIGMFQLIKCSFGITSLLADGFLYLIYGSFSNERAVK